MKKLTTRTKDLLLDGARTTGTFEEGFHYVFERLYTDVDTDELLRFAKYIDNEIGGAGALNIDALFRAFKNPNDKDAQNLAKDIKADIQRFRAF